MSHYIYDVALGDLNHDYFLDAVVANSAGDPIKIWLNKGKNGDGDWLGFEDSGNDLGNEISLRVALGNLDSDGDLDAFVANHTHPPWQDTFNKVYLNILESCITVNIDIKPGSCPNPLNVKAKGVLPATLLGTEDFDVTAIDPETICLTREGYEDYRVLPIRWDYQ